jgi:hypothetical protein
MYPKQKVAFGCQRCFYIFLSKRNVLSSKLKKPSQAHTIHRRGVGVHFKETITFLDIIIF